MPVTTKHSDYMKQIDDWTQCRDAAEGSRAVKARGALYLPMLLEQTPAEYDAYKARALWYGATARTIQGLGGSVFRKPMQLDGVKAMEEQLKDITLTGITLESFCKQALEEVLKIGRYGILVDMPKVVEGKDPGRPYWVPYKAEQIRNWTTEQVDGDTVLTQVVLNEEHLEKDAKDQFEQKCTEQYRVLRLINKAYTVELWRKRESSEGKADEWYIAETINPVKRGQPLDYIPFSFVGPTNVAPAPERPPLLDLTEVNLSHYRTSADLEHGRHFCGLPTPWVAGFNTDDTKLRIGSSVAWVSDKPEAHAGMLEFTGQGLGALERAIEEKQAQMAVLGARMLEPQKKSVEAADTHEARQSGETSALQSLAGSVEQAITQCLQWHSDWIGQAGEPTCELNKVFVEARMSPAELAELVKTWQAGGMAQETLYWNMQRGELTRPGVTFEEEKKLIEEQAPAMLPLGEGLDPDEDPENQPPGGPKPGGFPPKPAAKPAAKPPQEEE
jgi:Domain of unknown function (DUF4055)